VSFADDGRAIGEGVGWTRNGRVAVAYRRLDNADVATWTAELDNSGRLPGRTTNPNGTVRWTGIYATGAVSGNIDPTGTWQHGPGVSWTVTATANGRYHAQESGLGQASGPGYFTNTGTFKIDYVTRDGAIRGYYEMRFNPDGRTATGTVRELNGPQRTGTSNWTRIAGASTEPWLPGSFDWVAGQFLVVHPQHSVTVYLNGSKINEGRWEYLGRNQFRFTMDSGGFIDTVELSTDGKSLTGRNNMGNELRGTRRATSPRQ
jgi:hypothetical protein